MLYWEEDGIQCTRRIRALLPHARIVLITAYPDREFRRLGLEGRCSCPVDKKDPGRNGAVSSVEDLITEIYVLKTFPELD